MASVEKQRTSARAAAPRDADLLTRAGLITLDYISPPPELAAYAATLYHFRCDERDIRDMQPAAVGHLIVFLQGQGTMHFADGRIDPSHRVSLLTPCNAAVPIAVDGPWECVGVALSPLGWAALTRLHAGDWADRLLPAASILGPEAQELGEALAAAHRAGASGAELCRRLGLFMAARIKPVNPRHAALIQAVAGWLGTGFDPPITALNALSLYSPRQTQRLVERYFGLSPSVLRRKYRALRIVALLAMPEISDEQVAQLVDHYYDQSHMIREIRHFAGRTPGRLAQEGESMLAMALDIRNYREGYPQVAPLPPGFHANVSQ